VFHVYFDGGLHKLTNTG